MLLVSLGNTNNNVQTIGIIYKTFPKEVHLKACPWNALGYHLLHSSSLLSRP